MTIKKGLGRGFDSLIPTELLDESFDPTADQDQKMSDLRMVKLSQISPDSEQPRHHFDEAALDELADSVRRHGILQPIVVTPNGEGYLIVAGERRYRAALVAGLEKIPALVRSLDGQHKLELSLIENLQRRDLNAIETASAYLKLRDQFNMTLDDIGARVGGKSVSSVSNTLRLLRLPTIARQALVDGHLTEGQARPLINLDEAVVTTIVPRIIEESWSARKIEQYIVQLKQETADKKPVSEISQPYQTELARIQKRFGVSASLSTNTRGGGQIVLRFKDDAEFQRLQKLL